MFLLSLKSRLQSCCWEVSCQFHSHFVQTRLVSWGVLRFFSLVPQVHQPGVGWFSFFLLGTHVLLQFGDILICSDIASFLFSPPPPPCIFTLEFFSAYSVLLKIILIFLLSCVPRGANSHFSCSPMLAYNGFPCMVYNFDLGLIFNIFLLFFFFRGMGLLYNRGCRNIPIKSFQVGFSLGPRDPGLLIWD